MKRARIERRLGHGIGVGACDGCDDFATDEQSHGEVFEIHPAADPDPDVFSLDGKWRAEETPDGGVLLRHIDHIVADVRINCPQSVSRDVAHVGGESGFIDRPWAKRVTFHRPACVLERGGGPFFKSDVRLGVGTRSLGHRVEGDERRAIRVGRF